MIQFQELNKLYNQLMPKKEEKGKPKKVIVDEILKMTSGILAQVSMLFNIKTKSLLRLQESMMVVELFKDA